MEKEYDILARMTGFDSRSIERKVSGHNQNLSDSLLGILAKATMQSSRPMNSNTMNFRPQNENIPNDNPNTSSQDIVIKEGSGIPKQDESITHANYGRDSADSAAGGPERRALENQAAAAAMYGRNSSEQAKGPQGKPFVASAVATMSDDPRPSNIEEEERINPTIDDTDDTEARNRINSARQSIYTALGWDPEVIKEYHADPQNPKWNQYTTREPYGSEPAVGGPEPSVAAADARAADYLNNNSGGKKYNPVTGQWEPVRRSMFPSTFKKSFFFLNTLEA